MLKTTTEEPYDPIYRPLGKPIEEPFLHLRLDAYLANHFKFLTRNMWQDKIKAGEVFINQESIAKNSYKLRKGDQITYYYPIEREPQVDCRLNLLWESNDILAVYKPPGLPMHENGPFRHQTFAKFLKDQFGTEWSAVHRLDKETSGIVLCAATNAKRNQLAQKFLNHEIKKTYLALAKGIPAQPSWKESARLGVFSQGKIRIKHWVDPSAGQDAFTGFYVQSKYNHSQIGDFFLCKAEPQTGRTNQIRIHLAYKNHPLIGDKLYHPDENIFLEYYENGTTEKVIHATGHYRHCLHAQLLEFQLEQKEFLIESPLADDMQILMNNSKEINS